MNALIGKEFRESAKWAVLGAVGLLVCLFFAVTEGGNVGSIVSETFQGVTVVGFAAMAIILGAAQTLPEHRHDRWSFVVHRPVTRTRIFLAKVTAGVVLYLLACGVPLLLVTVWAARSDRVYLPPVPQMLEPSLADLLGGLGVYLASLLACARRARWLGSRITPLGVPVLAAGLVFVLAHHLAHAAAIHVTAVLLLFPAAWGAFVAAGSYEPLPRRAKLAQLVAVVCGMSMLVALGGAFVTGTLATLADGHRGPHRYEMYRLLRDERIVRTIYSSGGAGGPSTVETTDLSGNPLPELSSPQLGDADTYRLGVNLTSLHTSEARDFMSLAYQSRMLRSHLRYVHNLAWDTRDVGWVYLPTRGWIEGFDTRTKRRVARVGTNGFVAATQEPQPFDGMLDEPNDGRHRPAPVMTDRSGAYRVWPRDRRMEQIYAAPAGEIVTGVAYHSASASEEQQASNEALFVATTRRLHVIPPAATGALPFDIPIPQDRQWRFAAVGYLPDTHHAVAWFQPPPGAAAPAGAQAQRVLIYDVSGKLVRDEALPERREFPGVDRPRAIELPVYAAISPADVVVAYAVSLGEASLREMPGPAAAEFAITAVVALMCGAAGYFLARRHALPQPRRLLWAAGGAVFALPGVLTLLSVPEMPARVPCANCGRRRIVTRDTCEHCAAPFPPPASDGTEIFE